ncbi:MAG: FmdB family zinc ribbon protein [Candidatus Geothermincolia bacterium]
MPVYEYRCADCGGRFDRYVRSAGGDEENQVCPFCSSAKVKRSFSPFGLGSSDSEGSSGGSCNTRRSS